MDTNIYFPSPQLSTLCVSSLSIVRTHISDEDAGEYASIKGVQNFCSLFISFPGADLGMCAALLFEGLIVLVFL